MSTPIPDENIVAEIRMPDCDGNACLTFVVVKDNEVYCWAEFGDPVRVDPVKLEAVAIATSHLFELCPPSWPGLNSGKTFEEIAHGK